MTETQVREAISGTARMMAKAGLAEAFGHVSARWQDGFLITSVDPFMTTGAEDVIWVPDLCDPPSGGGKVPLETPMHAAVYTSRSDVNAICRGHPPSVVEWGVKEEDLPLLHGLGAIAGRVVRVHPDVDLISELSQAEGVATTLGDNSSVILRANGCLSVGGSLLEALTRLYFMEERARVALEPSNRKVEIDWGGRLRHTSPELTRAMAWMEAAFGGGT